MDRRDRRLLPRPGWLAGLALFASALIAPSAAGASVIAVNTTADEMTPGDGTCSLREALTAANTDGDAGGDCTAGSGPDTITIPHGTYTLTGSAGDDANASGDLDVVDGVGDGTEEDVTFQGTGDGSNPATDTIIDVGDLDRAIDVPDDPATGMDVSVNDLRIENGSVTGDGGGIRMQDANGSITLDRSTIQGSDATGDGGGLVMKGGTAGDEHQVQVIDSELDGNTAGGEGGGLFAETGSPDPTGSNSVELDGSTFSQNHSNGTGGAVYAEGVMRLDLLDSTLSGNSADGGGGAVASGLSSPEVHLQFSTIADNTTTSSDPLASGGIQTDSDAEQVYVEGTILANNQRSGAAANCGELDTDASDGVFHATSLGYSVESANSCGLNAAGDLPNTDPVLSSLADNGGETTTRALLLGSPAINHVPNSPTDYCHHTEQPDHVPPISVDLTTDQRGRPRPTSAGGLCDVGAWEGQPPSAAPAITDTDPDSPSNSLNPAVKGTASADSVTVQVFRLANCAGTAVGDTRAHFAAPGIPLTGLQANQANSLSARALSSDGIPSACSANFTYVHDGIALTPAITATSPASGSDENSPSVIGTAEAGSTVRIYVAGSCPAGIPLASGPQAVFSGGGLTVTVSDNSTTPLVANYTDLAGNVSACSAPVSYQEMTAAPPTPSPSPTPPPPKKKCKKKGPKKKCKKR